MNDTELQLSKFWTETIVVDSHYLLSNIVLQEKIKKVMVVIESYHCKNVWDHFKIVLERKLVLKFGLQFREISSADIKNA